MAKLEEIHNRILSCNKCGLCKGRKQAVPGNGNPNSDILFIGEAPGAKEDEQGVPFVGAAGKFLGEMLATIGMKKEDVFITNIVKCRPPKNRDPEKKEKDICSPYLQEQVEAMDAKLIVTLGRHSMNYFLPTCKISQDHGKLKRKDGKFYLPLYHPAAALYNGSLRETLIEDFSLIPKILKKIEELENEISKDIEKEVEEVKDKFEFLSKKQDTNNNTQTGLF
jgi:DNA polymerase